MLLYKGLGVSGNKADRKGDEILTVLPEEFGPDVQCKLVVEPKADEIYKAAIDYEKHIVGPRSATLFVTQTDFRLSLLIRIG